MMLLHFYKDGWEDIINEVYGDHLDPGNEELQLARTKIFDNARNFERKSLHRMEVIQCLLFWPASVVAWS